MSVKVEICGVNNVLQVPHSMPESQFQLAGPSSAPGTERLNGAKLALRVHLCRMNSCSVNGLSSRSRQHLSGSNGQILCLPNKVELCRGGALGKRQFHLPLKNLAIL